MVLGGSYGLSLPLWGYLCDLKVGTHRCIAVKILVRIYSQVRHSSKIVMGAGAALIILGFLIMGMTYWLVKI